MGVSNGIFSQQIGNGVTQLSVTRLGPKALQLTLIFTVFDGRGIHPCVDGLAGRAQRKAHQVAFVV